MQSKIAHRQSGMVLLSSLILVTTMVGITGYVLLFLVSDAKVVTEARQYHVAFYLAEAGLEAAQWEIGEVQDPDMDGIGNRTASTGIGTFTVNTVDLGGGNYQLTSTGSAGVGSVTLEETVRRTIQTRFPHGAIAIVGNVNDLDIEIEEDADLIIDGGNSPALSFSDVGVYNRIGQEFANAVDSGALPATNLSGAPVNTFTASSGNTVELPILQQPTYEDSLKDLTALYTNLVSKVNALRPTATVVGPTFAPTYGSPESPVTIYAPDLNSLTTQSITGYGTLIIGDTLALHSGSSLTWTGDIIVIGDSLKNAKLKISNNSTLDVTGNLVVLGEAAVNSELNVNNGGHATINGSLLFGTDWANPAAPKSKVDINNGGLLTVNGLLTMIGPQIEMAFSDPASNPNNKISVTGMMQIAVPSASVETKLELELEGAVEILKDDQMIKNGAEALNDLDTKYTVPEIQQLVDPGALTTSSWRRL